LTAAYFSSTSSSCAHKIFSTYDTPREDAQHAALAAGGETLADMARTSPRAFPLFTESQQCSSGQVADRLTAAG